MDDRNRVVGLVGHKVAVSLNNVEARGVELIGTLDEVRDDGIVLSEIGELGPGPTMFRPWDSLKRYSKWLPWLVRNTRSPNRAKYQRTGVLRSLRVVGGSSGSDPSGAIPGIPSLRAHP